MSEQIRFGLVSALNNFASSFFPASPAAETTVSFSVFSEAYFEIVMFGFVEKCRQKHSLSRRWLSIAEIRVKGRRVIAGTEWLKEKIHYRVFVANDTWEGAVKCGWGWRKTVARGYKFPRHISNLPPSHLRINWLKSKPIRFDFQLNSAPCSNFVS